VKQQMKLATAFLFVALFVTLQAVAGVQLCDTVAKLGN
jgi:hypothetical protein